MGEYDDILETVHPTAQKPMARWKRAAQFAPFAAMVGLDETLGETARLTERRVPLSEEEQAALNRTFRLLRERLSARPTVRLLCFEEDALKDGGRYVTVDGQVRAVEEETGMLVFTDHRRLPLDAVCAMELSE